MCLSLSLLGLHDGVGNMCHMSHVWPLFHFHFLYSTLLQPPTMLLLLLAPRSVVMFCLVAFPQNTFFVRRHNTSTKHHPNNSGPLSHPINEYFVHLQLAIMGCRTLFLGCRSTTANDKRLKQSGRVEHTEASMAISTHSRSKKIVRGIRQMFTSHILHNDTAPPSAATGFTHQDQPDSHLAAKSVEPEHVLLPTPTPSSTCNESFTPSTPSTSTPPTTAGSVAPEVKAVENNGKRANEYATALEELRDAEKILQQRHAMMKTLLQPQTTRKPDPLRSISGTSKAIAIVPPTTAGFSTSDAEATKIHSNEHTEYQTPIEELHGAEKRFQQRHTVIKLQPASKAPIKLLLRELSLERHE